MNQQLSWRTIVGYSLGDVANNFAFAMGALFLLSYYTDVAGVVNDLQRAGILGADRLEPWQQSGVCIFDLHGPRALLQPGEYSLWFTCYRDDPTTTIPRPSGRGSRDCRFINLCLPGISDRTEH